jgi:hypothetical protein
MPDSPEQAIEDILEGPDRDGWVKALMAVGLPKPGSKEARRLQRFWAERLDD